MEPATPLGTGDLHQGDARDREVEERALEIYAVGGTWLDALAQATAERAAGLRAPRRARMRSRVAPGKVSRTASLPPGRSREPAGSAALLHEPAPGAAATAPAASASPSSPPPPAVGAQPPPATPGQPALRSSAPDVRVTDDVRLELSTPPTAPATRPGPTPGRPAPTPGPPAPTPGGPAPASPGPATASTVYVFELRRRGTHLWLPIGQGTSSTLTWQARAAGHFEVRGKVIGGGPARASAPIALTVRLPDTRRIAGAAAVAQAMRAAWTETLKFSEQHPSLLREQGFWIRLDTSAPDRWLVTPVFVGDPGYVSDANPPSAEPRPIPPDGPPPSIDSGGSYTVAVFHTHTPTYFRTRPGPGARDGKRGVGPSPADRRFSHDNHMPGLVYDYVGSNGYALAGLALDAPARVYDIGPHERPPPDA